MNAAELIVTGIFGGWTIATLIRHLPPERLPRRVSFLLNSSLLGHFMPRWNFFAPNPGTWDYTLLYRDRNGEVVGPWREVRLRSAPRPLGLSAFWNPTRHQSKALVDMAGEINAAASEFKDNPGVLLGAVPYIALLTKVSAISGRYDFVATQFAVLATSSSDSQVIIASAYHKVA